MIRTRQLHNLERLYIDPRYVYPHKHPCRFAICVHKETQYSPIASVVPLAILRAAIVNNPCLDYFTNTTSYNDKIRSVLLIYLQANKNKIAGIGFMHPATRNYDCMMQVLYKIIES